MTTCAVGLTNASCETGEASQRPPSASTASDAASAQPPPVDIGTNASAQQEQPPLPNVAPALGLEPAPTPSAALAHVTAVEASGDRFSVTIRSNETGCDQYANWWEVVRPDGTLLYRRILAHSHVDEQPFTRSGGPVDVADDATVIVRAHMHPGGYGGAVMRGSKAEGFVVDTSVTEGFAGNLATTPPLPTGCAF